MKFGGTIGLISLCMATGLLLLCGGTTSYAQAQETTPTVQSPLSTADSLAHFQLHPDLRIELVAAEPDVIDPVAVRFDQRGRMWVVEMRDYPNGPAEGEPPRSRISVLEDRDGDGRYETAQVFADQLLFVTGLQPWRGGVIVTLAGEVAYLRDDDGDGRADTRETWFTGFVMENPQLRANHPTLGLDHQVYVANGLRGGNVVTERPEWKQPDAKPISISGRDFRFDPLTGAAEAISGVGQFGLTFDDYGRRFICSNRNPLMHVVLPDRYLRRNPFLAVGSVINDVSPAAAESHVYPISRFWTTSTLHEGQFTAACGVTIYRGDALPEAFYGNSFTCEPTGNLVHRDRLQSSGATFTSTPGREGVEFLASPDTWFRPVNLTVGPDGALYVVDMYRAVIEHPQWMPEELRDRRDLEYGNDRGRIWRIVSKNSKTKPQQPQLHSASSAELVKCLQRPGSWWRETAQRLLIERQDASVQADLEQLVKTAAQPTTVTHALWTLRGLHLLSDPLLKTALTHGSPRVREQAVLLAEGGLADAKELHALVLALARDDDPRVRFQVALSLGETDINDDVLTALAEILQRSPKDPWTHAAVFSATPDDADRLLGKVMKTADELSNLSTVIEKIATLIGARLKPEEISAALQQLTRIPATIDVAARTSLENALIGGLGQGIRRRGKTLNHELAKLPAEETAARVAVATAFHHAAETAGDDKQELAARLIAVELLRYAPYETAGPVLFELARSDEQRLQLAAINALSDFPEKSIGPQLLEEFDSYTPAIRRAIVSGLIGNTGRVPLLLDAIEEETVAIAELGAANVNLLTKHKNKEIQQRAKKLLISAIPADRGKVLAEYQQALKIKADPQRGRRLFEKTCSTCHRIGEIGVEIGPDIADSRTRQPAALLNDILNPNGAIDANYVSYTVLTNDGKTVTGIIAAETASSVTIKQPEGKMVTLLRQDIDEVISNGVSLMPEGLEKNLDLQSMADLISFIKNWRYLDGAVPLRE